MLPVHPSKLLEETHSYGCGKSGCSCGLSACQITVAVFRAPRHIDRGDVRWQLLGEHRSREVPKLFLWEEKAMLLLLSLFYIIT